MTSVANLVFKDMQGAELKQGDIVVCPERRDKLVIGVVKSLSWSKTSNKYIGVKVAYKDKYGIKHRTHSIWKSGFLSILVFAPLDPAPYSELVEKCKQERWETQPGNQADGTKILSFLTYSQNHAKSWASVEKTRQQRLLNPNHSYYGWNQLSKTPTRLETSVLTSKGNLHITYQVNLNNQIDYKITVDKTPLDAVSLISTFNLPPSGVFTRLQKVIDIVTYHRINSVACQTNV